MTVDLSSLLQTGLPIITGIFGGAAVKVANKIMSKRSIDFNESVKIREELREQIIILRSEIDEWKREADEWRTKYWEQVEINIDQKSAIETVRNEVEALKRHFTSPHNPPEQDN